MNAGNTEPNARLSAQLRSELKLYQAGLPFHSPGPRRPDKVP